MNIFLPYEKDIGKSIKALDDLRLNKQILECYQLLLNAEREHNGFSAKGYGNHPVYLFYKENIPFLAYYGYECCRELYWRTKKWHSLVWFFDSELDELKMFHTNSDGFIDSVEIPKFTPYYMEGSKGQANYIRTTENVSKLFQDKLCKKWEQDKAKGRNPKWTNRDVPEFYEKWLQGDNK